VWGFWLLGVAGFDSGEDLLANTSSSEKRDGSVPTVYLEGNFHGRLTPKKERTWGEEESHEKKRGRRRAVIMRRNGNDIATVRDFVHILERICEGGSESAFCPEPAT